MPPLYNDWFRGKSPADIITMVATIGLTTISEWSEQELKRVGWTNNPIIDILYSLTSAGVWIAKTDTSGQDKVVEANSADIRTRTLQTAYGAMGPFVNALMSAGSSTVTMFEKRVTTVPYALAGGVQANLSLCADTGEASFNVIDGIIVIPVNALAGGLTMQFESPAGTAIGDPINTGALVANTPNLNLRDVRIYNGTDNEALVVDLSGGAGVETGRLMVFWHKET